MQNLDTFRLLRLILAGAIGGVIIYLIFNPSYVQEEAGRRVVFDPFEAIGDAFISSMILGAAIGALLGGMLLLADEYASPPRRIAVRMLQTAGIGLLCGMIAGLVAQVIFLISGIVFLLGWIFIIIGRAVAWAVMGGGAGIGIGFALGSWKRAKMTLIGGLIGGFAGGLVFDVIAEITKGGSMSRFIGFTILGAALGAAIVFVEDVAKQCWVTILSGSREGRSYILTKPVTTIGRDELADIPLFGDPGITKEHAHILVQTSMASIRAVAGNMVTVNGMPVQTAMLNDSDLIKVGKHSLRFSQKAAKRVDYLAYPQKRWSDPQPQYPSASMQQPTMYAPQQATIPQPIVQQATGNISLTVTAGLHLNQRFQFGPGTIRVGREQGHGILLAQDTMVSRSHAEISWNGSSWTLSDLGSTNGTWLNGNRITSQVLAVGDTIGIGQTALRVDAL